MEASGSDGSRAGFADLNQPPQMPSPPTTGETGPPQPPAAQESPSSPNPNTCVTAEGPAGMEKCGPTSAEVGVAAGAEDAEEAGLQGVAGVIAGDVSKFLGEQQRVKREAGGQA